MTPAAAQSRTVFVDSSAFGALLNRTDALNMNATRILQGLRRDGRRLLTTNFIVAESHALILSRTNYATATRFLIEFDRTGFLLERITPEDEEAAKAIIVRYDDKLFSFVDATSFAIMERLGIAEAFTFDSDFQQYGFRSARP
jgi:predicted nucleic acid-binding protein